MSAPIKVRVAEPGVTSRHPSPPDAKVYFVYPADGA